LLKIPPQADVEAEKIRLELTEMEKTDEIRKKEATREISLKNTTKTEKQKKSKEEAQKKSPKKERPSKQRAQVIAKQEFVSEEEEEEAVYVANVPVQKNAFLAVVYPNSLWLKAQLGEHQTKTQCSLILIFCVPPFQIFLSRKKPEIGRVAFFKGKCSPL